LRRFRQDQAALKATLRSQAAAKSLQESEAVERQLDHEAQLRVEALLQRR